MAATLLTNVVYPVYTRRRYIRHFTPGKWWDCLYTWDSGFIALGLLELDIERAIDCLNAYTTPPGDPQAAFIHHGSPAPIQMYAFLELWNRTQDRRSAGVLLSAAAPDVPVPGRAAGQLDHAADEIGPAQDVGLLLQLGRLGRLPAAGPRPPPRPGANRHAGDQHVARICARPHPPDGRTGVGAAGRRPDYEADIAAWTDALNRYSWDAEAGYFSYVTHDDRGEPTGILRHESGANYDMGLDGASPLFAGICNAEQEAALIGHLSSDQRMWTRIGLSTVDQSAPYFKVDGYWNGAVWMPYQWIVWKALLDLGHGDLALRIGRTALDLWKSEVDATYNCFEHFIVQSGRGAGWHHFGGLSSPVLSWFGAYHRPGRLTCGFDTWVVRQEFGEGNRLSGRSSFRHGSADRPSIVLATMAPGEQYRVTWNGQPVTSREVYPGALEITLPGGEGWLRVEK